MVRHCKNCGNELDENTDFCTECGTKFGETQPKITRTINGTDPFSTYKVDMIPGENIIRSSQIHVGCLYAPLIVILIGFLIPFMMMIMSIVQGYFYAGAVIFLFLNPVFLLGILWFIIRYIGYKNNDLILTNKRVFGKCGLISTTQMQSPLNKIDSVSFSNGLIGKIIGYGIVEIATTSSHFKFRYIRDGQTFYNDIFNQLEKSQKEKITLRANAIAEAIKKN